MSWLHWDWMYSLPCCTWCSSWRFCVQEEAAVHSSWMLTTCCQILKSTSVEASFVWSTVSTLKPAYDGTVSLSPPLKAMIIVNNCKKKKNIDFSLEDTVQTGITLTLLSHVHYLNLSMASKLNFSVKCWECFAFKAKMSSRTIYLMSITTYTDTI